MSQSSTSWGAHLIKGAFAVLAALTIYYGYEALRPEADPTPALQAEHQVSLPLGENFIVVDPNLRTFQISANNCKATVKGVNAVSKGGICTVSIDRAMYPRVRGVGGFCSDIDATSPQNTATQLVLNFRGGTSFIFELAAAKQWRLASTQEAPPLSISGLIETKGTYEVVPCDSLPADPN